MATAVFVETLDNYRQSTRRILYSPEVVPIASVGGQRRAYVIT
jgi:hypothetical protein